MQRQPLRRWSSLTDMWRFVTVSCMSFTALTNEMRSDVSVTLASSCVNLARHVLVPVRYVDARRAVAHDEPMILFTIQHHQQLSANCTGCANKKQSLRKNSLSQLLQQISIVCCCNWCALTLRTVCLNTEELYASDIHD